MKTLSIKFIAFGFCVICLAMCKSKEEDYDEIKADYQRIVDQISYSWQISEFRISTTESDSVVNNAQYIQFVPCNVSQNNGTCDEGYYQIYEDNIVSFEYTVDRASEQVLIRVLERDFVGEDLSGNWRINKVTEDSLILSDGGDRARTLKLFKE